MSQSKFYNSHYNFTFPDQSVFTANRCKSLSRPWLKTTTTFFASSWPCEISLFNSKSSPATTRSYSWKKKNSRHSKRWMLNARPQCGFLECSSQINWRIRMRTFDLMDWLLGSVCIFHVLFLQLLSLRFTPFQQCTTIWYVKPTSCPPFPHLTIPIILYSSSAIVFFFSLTLSKSCLAFMYN